MATLSKEILQRCFHPLTEVPAGSEFFCKGCRTPGFGTRYRCEVCDLDLHEYCVDCPMELSSFMHQHSLKLVGCKPSHGCDLCDDPVEGLFYRCELCDFNVHPICTQLPEYTQHVMHKDHPLRLEISVPIGCMVCKDMCSSWRYRCEVCCFHLHLHCTLAPPCEEETTMSKTKTRSLGIPAPPQPSAWPPAFGAYNCGYGYWGIPPQYFAQPPFAPHVHGYGGIHPPPPQYFAQYSFAPYVHSYGGIHPPPQYLAQPSFPTDADHGYGTPSTYHAQSADGHGASSTDHAQSSHNQVQGHGGKFRKIMDVIVGVLTGAVGNVVGGVFLNAMGLKSYLPTDNKYNCM